MPEGMVLSFISRCRDRRAVGGSSHRSPASVPYTARGHGAPSVAEVVGLLRGNDLSQLLLHLQRVLAAVRQSQPSGDADAVGIADVAVLSVDIAQDQIGGLAPHTGQ